jgi:beta-xylosidase
MNTGGNKNKTKFKTLSSWSLLLKDYKIFLMVYIFIVISFTDNTFSQNPIIMDQFTADPAARVFEGKIYVYPSHDILASPGKGRIGWFCMADYHVFSSDNLTDWRDHGVIVNQNNVPWVDSTSYSMWAPDCIFRNGKYYFYFPARSTEKDMRGGMEIGVAISDKPYGPFTPQSRPIKGVSGIDPNIFIDKDGQAYIYWAGRGGITGAKLNRNMLELASEPKAFGELPKGFKEGPFLFERKGIYYLTFPFVIDSTESLAYCMSDNPMGPFKYAGVIMDKSPTSCWTNHQSFINFKDQWFLFYHHNDLSPKFDKSRSVRIDSMFFNADGTIRKVIPTLRGVGFTDASKKIHIDRYSHKSEKGASIAFLDSLNTFEGWKTIFDTKDAWIQYNGIDFGKKSFTSVNVQTSSNAGGNLQLRLNSVDGPVVAKVYISQGEGWRTIKVPVTGLKHGIQNLVMSLTDNNPVEVDWISFE